MSIAYPTLGKRQKSEPTFGPSILSKSSHSWQRSASGSAPGLHKRGDNQVYRARVLEVRIHLPPADSPSLSGFRLRSWKSPGFRQCRGEAKRHGRQRRARSSNIALMNGGVSVGRYFSTAVSPMRFAPVGRRRQARLRPSRCTVAPSGPAQAKPSTARCSRQPSGIRECASSLSAVRSGG